MTLRFDQNITIDGGTSSSEWNAGRYQRVVAGLLRSVLQSDTGRAIRLEITRPLTIRTRTLDRAVTWSTDPIAATRQGRMVRHGHNGFGYLTASGTVPRGTGLGSGAVIDFIPADHGPPSPTNFLSPDAVLVHELTHAVRIMAGVQHNNRMGDGFDTIEEFFAILVGNIYRSELGRTALCPNHNPTGPLAHERDYLRGRGRLGLVDQMAREQPRFTRNLSRVRGASFNPFLDYY